MPEAPVIRAASRSDRSLLLHFHRELYVRYRDQILDPELAPLYAYTDLEQALRDDVDAILQGPQSLALVAERGGEAVGYITGHIENDRRRLLPKRGVVEDWYVDDGARGEGVGHALLEALTEHFTRSGCDVVESGTWAFNSGARAAHARAGFVEIEVRFRKILKTPP